MRWRKQLNGRTCPKPEPHKCQVRDNAKISKFWPPSVSRELSRKSDTPAHMYYFPIKSDTHDLVPFPSDTHDLPLRNERAWMSLIGWMAPLRSHSSSSLLSLKTTYRPWHAIHYFLPLNITIDRGMQVKNR